MEKFLFKLEKFRRRWQAAMIRCIMLEFSGWLVFSLACLCWLDFFFAFDSGIRIIMSCLCLAALSLWLGFRISVVLRITRKDSAIYADNLLKNPRRDILSALEIGSARTDTSPLSAYLARKGVEDATKHLTSIEGVPLHRLPRSIRKRLLLIYGLAIIPALLNPGATSTLVSRFVFPHADIPPYSAFVFTIKPENPDVIYGDDQVIHVAVTGGKISKPIRFATRKAGHILESPCFQAEDGNYVQRLERVMQPMDFCFLLGNARSKWHHINVLYQPKVISGRIRLIPPEYTNRPEKIFELGSEPLEGLKGSRVEMTLQSNRPLKNGFLSIQSVDAGGHSETIPGEVSGHHQISCKWEIKTSAHLTMMIFDILGTPANEPLKILQTLQPDQKPVVTLAEPQIFSLATPNVKIPVTAVIEDDIGINQCFLYKALKGYQSRTEPVSILSGETTHEINREIDLTDLGVEPGQVIELFMEVTDTNPELTGSGASDIARIKIISEDEYAKMVRARTTIDLFESRFRNVAEGYTSLIFMLQEIKTDLENDRMDPEKIDEKTGKLLSDIKAMNDEINQLANDFSAFDLEKRLSQSSVEMAHHFERIIKDSGWKSTDRSLRLKAVSDALKLLRNDHKESHDLENKAIEAATVGRVMELAVKYRNLIDRQRIITGRLKQYADFKRQEFIARPMVELEASIRNDLKDTMDQLTLLARALPPEYMALRQSALDFVNKVERAGILAPMQSCENACINEQPREAWNHAATALDKMEEVLGSCNSSCFGQICSNEIRFKVPDDLSLTMTQMLESLLQQYAQGVGWGNGFGSAGVGIAGAWEGSYLNGYSAFSFPVYGPERKNPFSSAASATGENGRQGTGQGVIRKTHFKESIKDNVKEQTGGTGFFMGTVPARYQDAVKSFYSGEVQ